MASRRKLRPSAALATYVESLVEGRRVVVFGDATSGLAELLVERGARIVHVYDPDPIRAAEATAKNTSRSISHAPLPPSGLAARDGAFELGIVDDLNGAGPAHSIVNRLRRALAPRGVALVAIPNPNVQTRLIPVSVPSEGALDYYELYDTLKGEFSYVRMLGQAPFIGYAVVDFAAGSPDPSLDSSLLPGGSEEPEWFIGVASDTAVSLDEFAVVQMPLAETWPTGGTQPTTDVRSERIVARLEAETERLRRELHNATDAAGEENLERKLASQDKWVQELESRLSIADERADDALEALENLREEVASRSERPPTPAPMPVPTRSAEDARRLSQLEADATKLASELERSANDARAKETRLAEANTRLSVVNAKLTEANARLSETGAKLSETGAKLDATNAKLAGANAKIAQLETSLSQAKAATQDRGQERDYEFDVSMLEKQLSERGQEVRKLNRDIATLERLGRELLNDLEERGQGGGADADALKTQLDTLAHTTAEREADLQAARWTIQALEGQLSGGSLGVELQEARAELSRQATLIAQLKAHGSA